MKRILVLGGYGLIGSNVCRQLVERGHEVVALGRDIGAARRVLPGFTCVIRDLRTLLTPDAWQPLIEDVDFVVNCAGALQDNAHDDLEAVHLHAIGALVLACEKAGTGVVQISAVGADPHAALRFYRTKAEGDALIRESTTEWWIFRPGLVVAPSAYGGTTLIRTLAGVPLIQPIALPRALVQTVSVRDVAEAVARAIEGETPPRSEADLVEQTPHPLVDIIAATRRWLGFRPAAKTVAVPGWALRLVSSGADLFGHLGWRSPFRSTAMKAIAGGVTGNPAQTRLALGRPALSLTETFLSMPAGVEDRLFSRMQLLSPLLLFALGLSWVWKGVAGYAGMDPTVAELVAGGMPSGVSRAVVAVLATLAIVLGLSVFIKPWAVRTLVVMVFVLLFYAAAMTIMAPQLWFDPYGAGANVLPIIVASLVARLMLDTR